MVRTNVLNRVYEGGETLTLAEIYGLSTDDKPVSGLVTGSKFIEVDTGLVFLFDEEGDTGEEWIKVGLLCYPDSEETTPDDSEPADDNK